MAAQPLPGAAASTAAAAGSAAGGAPQAGVPTDSSMLAGTSGTGVPASPVVASGVPPPVADARAPVPSTKPKGNVNWICGACDVLNVATSAQCTVCSTSRDFGTGAWRRDAAMPR
ncbi:hypothetical protein EON68_03540 [archaeon]|nr:MAG: hypothetical protein EON68_03540 [archaeon]